MGFFHSLSKLVSAGSKIGDPVSAALRKKGGALGTVGAIINPGAAAADKFAGGAPITAKNMLDPNGWSTPVPINQGDSSAPPPVLPPLGQQVLPPQLARKPVMYPQPPLGGAFQQQAFGMAGIPQSMLSGAPVQGPIPIGPPPQVTPIGLQPTPTGPSTMQTPDDILRMLRAM